MALTEQAGLFTVPTTVKRRDSGPSRVSSSAGSMTLQGVATSHTILAWATNARAKWETKSRRTFVTCVAQNSTAGQNTIFSSSRLKVGRSFANHMQSDFANRIETTFRSLFQITFGQVCL